MNPVGLGSGDFGRMCNVQQESRAFSSDQNSAAEDSIKTVTVLLYSTLFSVYVCLFWSTDNVQKKKLWTFEKWHFYRDRPALVWLTK